MTIDTWYFKEIIQLFNNPCIGTDQKEKAVLSSPPRDITYIANVTVQPIIGLQGLCLHVRHVTAEDSDWLHGHVTHVRDVTAGGLQSWNRNGYTGKYWLYYSSPGLYRGWLKRQTTPLE